MADAFHHVIDIQERNKDHIIVHMHGVLVAEWLTYSVCFSEFQDTFSVWFSSTFHSDFALTSVGIGQIMFFVFSTLYRYSSEFWCSEFFTSLKTLLLDGKSVG